MGSGFPIKQLLTTQSHILALQKYTAPVRSDNSLSDRTLYTRHAFEMVKRARPKRYSKSTIALFLSNTHLHQFYLLEYILWHTSHIYEVSTQVWRTSATMPYYVVRILVPTIIISVSYLGLNRRLLITWDSFMAIAYKTLSGGYLLLTTRYLHFLAGL